MPPLGGHGDGPTRTLLVTDSATGALVEVEPVAQAGAQFDHRLLGTSRVAAVALKSVAARETALGLVARRGGIEPLHDLVEGAPPAVEADTGL